MTAGLCAMLAAISWHGYTAFRAYETSASELRLQRADFEADRLLRALLRDMRGAQESVLMSFPLDSIFTSEFEEDVTVAGAFARYPYPESFFAWRGPSMNDSVIFFNRSTRPPVWGPQHTTYAHYPLVRNRYAVQGALLANLLTSHRPSDTLIVTDTEIDSIPYQVVARRRFADAYHDRVAGGIGFIVNLKWVRTTYFRDMIVGISQIAPVGTFAFRVTDDNGITVATAGGTPDSGPVVQRHLPLIFADPLAIPANLKLREWGLGVSPAAPVSEPLVAESSPVLYPVFVVAAAMFTVGLLLASNASKRAAELADLRADFVATITHELKTPIASIRALGDAVAAKRVVAPVAVREYAQMVVDQTARLSHLVDNALAYSRVTDAANLYTFEPVSIADVVDESLERLASPLAAGGFELDCDIGLDLPLVEADKAALVLVFTNILDNAIRYSNSCRSIRIHSRTTADLLSVTVSDSGIGIAPDEIATVRSKFVRGRGATSGGTGLGLAIVGRIATAHRGTVEISSVPDIGTSVTVSLPIQRAIA